MLVLDGQHQSISWNSLAMRPVIVQLVRYSWKDIFSFAKSKDTQQKLLETNIYVNVKQHLPSQISFMCPYINKNN